MGEIKILNELGKLIVACEVYIVHDGKVLMHKRSKTKKLFPGYWLGPGGHVNENEDALSAAMREIKEETGVNLSEKNIVLKVLAFHHHVDRNEVWIEYLFRGNIGKKQRIKSSEEGYSKWIEIKDLKKMRKVFPPSRYYLDHILNNKKGIVYNFSLWKNANLVKVLSERIGS